MISVIISINGNPIMARSAVNQQRTAPGGGTVYHCDDGQTIIHDPGDGAVALAHKLLDTIQEKPREPSEPTGFRLVPKDQEEESK